VMALDPKNPLLAARLLQPLGHWRRHDAMRQGLMRGALERVLALPGLSRNAYEIATKSLAEPA
jgi:aminopeptidase N